MAMEANTSPWIAATKGMRRAQRDDTRPKAATTAKTTQAVRIERVAPQNISPAMTSSKFKGVLTIASYVLC